MSGTDNLTLVESRAFMVSSPNGDVVEGTSQGLFVSDTRFLSKFAVRVNGWSPEILTSGTINNYAATIYATNPADSAFATRTLSIIRDRFVGDGVHEDIFIANHGENICEITLTVEFDADFGDIFDVKQGRFEDPKLTAVESSAEFPLIFSHAHDGISRRTLISFSEDAEAHGKSAVFKLALAPKEHWKTCVIVHPAAGDRTLTPKFSCGQFDLGAPPAPEQTRWVEKLPKLSSANDDLKKLYDRSVSDLAALRFEVRGFFIPAAGLPWFMTIFGRDSIITALQALPISLHLATDTLKLLADLQGREIDDFRDEQPGKIVHEVRSGELALMNKVPHSRYYGTIDATPLWLILLGEAYRWTADPELVRSLMPAAEAALSWIDKYGDMDGDGFVEYETRSARGLRNQGWKDSRDAVVFSDGRIAEGSIALAEVQGYVYRAKMSAAELFGLLGRDEKAARLREEARLLKQRFNERFWMDRENFFAMALDGAKNQVDSITSNPGHCLWSGIIDPDKGRAVADRLLAEDMFSGWGIRTMSEKMAAYNPLAYHNGSVWPHDNSLIAAGLAAYGFHDHAGKVITAIIEAAANTPDGRLPELFAGFRRRPAGFPVAYPTASSPQAWATGAVFMFLQTLLGVTPRPEKKTLETAVRLPQSIENVEMEGVRAFGRQFRLSGNQTRR